MELHPPSVLPVLFREFEHTAWRLESQPSYEADRRSARYAEWLRGDPWPDESAGPWYASRRALTETGRRIERVRLVSSPPTEGERYLLARAPLTIAVGEDIRCLDRGQAQALGLPHADFWLFDSRTVALFHYEGERQLGIELVADPAAVLPYCQIRDAAWHYAVPHSEFVTRVASGA
ncbi:DUF6879 family protein [Kitasatospora cineracea]|uniref:DUF6879 family protein n=1 Tax=Kitasatospora cineracea TaxID=88074 RepID=UPI00343DB9BD